MIKDLGVLNGPILVFGGPYSNLQATEAVLDKAKELKIPFSNVICTGDITAYCGSPQETTELLKNSGTHIIQGNCDESLAQDNDDCDCGFDNNTACELLAVKWFQFSKDNTDTGLKNWMGTLPHRLEFTFGSRKFHVLHGSNSSINEFIFESTSDDHKLSEINQTNADVIIGGHNGIHFTSVIDNKMWHNAGVIGMPANDGTSRTWYSIISEDNDRIIFEHKFLEYDYKSAAKIMIQNNLHEYAETIQRGLWPSLDVLPKEERAKTGVACQEEIIVFPNDL